MDGKKKASNFICAWHLSVHKESHTILNEMWENSSRNLSGKTEFFRIMKFLPVFDDAGTLQIAGRHGN